MGKSAAAVSHPAWHGVNTAAELGPLRFPWWQDWRGKTTAIIASGPSAKGAPLHLLRDKAKVIAIKENIELCPWADVVYGCDGAWWKWRRGLPDFNGVKLTYDGQASGMFPGLHKVEIRNVHEILTDEPGVIGSGKNSGFQAINIAIQFGAERIILIGYDMTDRSGTHWYGRNNAAGMNNPDENNFSQWRRALAGIVPDLDARGIEVVNASEYSALTCFPKMTIEQALARWT